MNANAPQSLLPASPLIADGLGTDKRVIEAKKLLRAALGEHQKKIINVRPADPSRAISYKQLLEDFGKLRAGTLWHPYIGSGIGNGALVELLDGSVKYDLIAGIGPHYFGHSYPPLLEIGIDAVLADTVMQGHLQQNREGVELTKLLINSSGMTHCFLSSSGAMANENALKLAFHKHFPANRVLAFTHCFAGRTLSLSQVTDKPAYRQGVPTTLAVDYIPFYDYKRPEESTKETVSALKNHITRYPKQHAVMCLELVQGEGGFYYGTRDFYIAIIDVLKENNIAVFADEVQSFGRTPRLFAFQHFGLEGLVDIVSIGKLSQVCATLFQAEYRPQPGLLSQTFTASTAALRAALFIIKELLEGNYFGSEGKIMQLHRAFTDFFADLERSLPGAISGPYGIGAMIAFTPYNGLHEEAMKLVHALFDAGIIAFIAGSHPTRIRFLPPAGILCPADLPPIFAILKQTISEQRLK